MKFTNNADLAGFKILNLPDATSAQEPVTLAQMQAAMRGWKWKDPVRAATTANITLSGEQTIDGVAIVSGDRVLVKDQSTGSANGIYVAAAGAWTRAADFDQSSEVLGASVFVSEGTDNGNSQWFMTTDAPITIDTTSLVWAKVGGGASYTAGNGITISGGVVAVDPAVVTRKAAATIGDGGATSITVTHNLGTLDVTVTVRDVITGAQVLVDNAATGSNQIQLTFGTPPSVGQYRVIVQG